MLKSANSISSLVGLVSWLSLSLSLSNELSWAQRKWNFSDPPPLLSRVPVINSKYYQARGRRDPLSNQSSKFKLLQTRSEYLLSPPLSFSSSISFSELRLAGSLIIYVGILILTRIVAENRFQIGVWKLKNWSFFSSGDCRATGRRAWYRPAR